VSAQTTQVELAISARDSATATLTTLSSAIQQFTATNESAADRARASSVEYQAIVTALNTLKQSMSDLKGFS